MYPSDPVREIPDHELYLLMLSGDRTGFLELYKRYKHPLFRFAVRMLGNREAAEDAVHDTFVRLLVDGQAITEPSALKAWLYRVVRNESLMALRRKRDCSEEQSDTVWETETPHTAAEHSETKNLVHKALAELRTEYREVLLLREFEGLTYEEIAVVTGDSGSSVKSRLFKARRALAERLAPIWNEERKNL